MRFTQHSSSEANIIRGYGSGEVRVNNEVYRRTVIVAASTLSTLPGVSGVGDFTMEHVAQVLELMPEVVLVGTGERQIFPDPALTAQFLRAGVGVEIMDTGAACRTYNVLVGEQRRVVAVLMV